MISDCQTSTIHTTLYSRNKKIFLLCNLMVVAQANRTFSYQNKSHPNALFIVQNWDASIVSCWVIRFSVFCVSFLSQLFFSLNSPSHNIYLMNHENIYNVSMCILEMYYQWVPLVCMLNIFVFVSHEMWNKSWRKIRMFPQKF